MASMLSPSSFEDMAGGMVAGNDAKWAGATAFAVLPGLPPIQATTGARQGPPGLPPPPQRNGLELWQPDEEVSPMLYGTPLSVRPSTILSTVPRSLVTSPAPSPTAAAMTQVKSL